MLLLLYMTIIIITIITIIIIIKVMHIKKNFKHENCLVRNLTELQ